MLFADAFTPGQYLLLGLLALGTGLYLRRGWKKGKVVASPNPVAEARASIRLAQSTPEGIAHQAAAELGEFTREVAGRMETRIAVLDQLIVEADQKIARLEETLETGRESTDRTDHSPGPDLILHPHAQETSHEPQITRAITGFREAGYTLAEIAVLVSLPEANVQAILDAEQDSDQREAA